MEKEGCNAESVACSEVGRGTMLDAHKVRVTCSSTRGLNIYLFVTQGSLTVKGIVVKREKRGKVGLYVLSAYRLHEPVRIITQSGESVLCNKHFHVIKTL